MGGDDERESGRVFEARGELGFGHERLHRERGIGGRELDGPVGRTVAGRDPLVGSEQHFLHAEATERSERAGVEWTVGEPDAALRQGATQRVGDRPFAERELVRHLADEVRRDHRGHVDVDVGAGEHLNSPATGGERELVEEPAAGAAQRVEQFGARGDREGQLWPVCDQPGDGAQALDVDGRRVRRAVGSGGRPTRCAEHESHGKRGPRRRPFEEDDRSGQFGGPGLGEDPDAHRVDAGIGHLDLVVELRRLGDDGEREEHGAVGLAERLDGQAREEADLAARQLAALGAAHAVEVHRGVHDEVDLGVVRRVGNLQRVARLGVELDGRGRGRQFHARRRRVGGRRAGRRRRESGGGEREGRERRHRAPARGRA